METETKEAPALAPNPDRTAAALAAVQALDSAAEPPADDDKPGEAEVAQDTEGPGDEQEEEAGQTEQKRISTLLAKLAKQDKQIQALRAQTKQAVALEQLRADPMRALQAVGIGPQQILDLYLQTPIASQQEPGQPVSAEQQPPQTDAEVAALRAELDSVKRALQARDEHERAKARGELYRNELVSVHQNVSAQGDRWEMIAARRGESGLASNGGGAYDLAVETAQEIYRQRLSQLDAPTDEDVRSAAPSWEEVLDAVEEALVEDWRKRSQPVSSVKKLQSAQAPARAAKPKKAASLPPARTETPLVDPAKLTYEERMKRAAARLEALDRAGIRPEEAQ
jgi:hypothetical protein